MGGLRTVEGYRNFLEGPFSAVSKPVLEQLVIFLLKSTKATNCGWLRGK